MAHRLLVRRIWTLSVKDVRCPRAPSSALYSTSLCSSASPQTLLSPRRSLPRALPVTARREVSFNVQDQEDFTERVINSELPVVVDFHAQLRIILPWPFQNTQPDWFFVIMHTRRHSQGTDWVYHIHNNTSSRCGKCLISLSQWHAHVCVLMQPHNSLLEGRLEAKWLSANLATAQCTLQMSLSQSQEFPTVFETQFIGIIVRLAERKRTLLAFDRTKQCPEFLPHFVCFITFQRKTIGYVICKVGLSLAQGWGHVMSNWIE